MEILFVSHKYPPATGGMEKQSFELITGLAKLTKIHTIVYTTGSRLTFFLLVGKRIRRMVKANPGISIIHFNDGLMATASLLHRSPKHLMRAVTFHGLDVVFPSSIFQKLILPKFNKFDQIFAVSQATANACKIRGISSDKIIVVNNGVDISERVQTSRLAVDKFLKVNYSIDTVGKSMLVAIGRPVKRKGFSWFIRHVLPTIDNEVILLLIGPVQSSTSFISHLISLMPSAVRHHVELFLGTPSDERELRNLLTYPDHNSRVVRMGKLSLDDMNAILSVTDAFVMPNIEVPGDMEGFGLVCLEACIQGTIVFAAASGGITDAITDGKNGHLLPVGDVLAWSNALKWSLATKEKNSSHAEERIAFTKNHFSWQKMCAEYLQHFLKLGSSTRKL
jgi:glycosyltransferase involved in cell wall biosynthesis